MVASQYGYEDCCMSEILKMATAFEQRSKEQAENTEKAVKSALKKHEHALLLALSENEKTTSDAIRAQSQRLKRTALSSWMAVAIPVIVTLLLSAGAIWAMGWYIKNQVDTITQQNATISRLSEQGGDINLTFCGDNRRLCAEIHPDSLGENPKTFGENGQYRILKGY